MSGEAEQRRQDQAESTAAIRRRSWSRLGWIAGLLALAWFGWTANAVAHALPERAIPPIDGSVASPPTKVEVWFSQEVDPNQTKLTVIAPDGSQVDLGNTAVDLNDPHHQHVTVGLRPGLAPGRYTVQWHSRSIVDSDAVDGSFTFTIGGATNQAGATRQPTARSAAAGALAAPTSAAMPKPMAASSAAPVKPMTATEKSKSSSDRTIIIVIAVVVVLLVGGRLSRQSRKVTRR